MRTRKPLHERFWALVEKNGPDECWPWLGSSISKGYGCVYTGRAKRCEYTHRIAYELHHGQEPGVAHVCHRCDNPPCCNPAHLFLGTNAENSADKARKGRAARKLTRETVLAIRSEFVPGVTKASLARKWGISERQVFNIVNGLQWRLACA